MVVPTLLIAQNQSNTEKADPLSFVKTAADIAGNVQPAGLDGYTAIYVSEQHWADGLKDGDLGPFLKLKEAKAGRSAAFFFSQSRDAAICVFFDGKSPFGVAAVHAGSGGSIQTSDIQAAYKPVSKDMLKKGEQEWQFSENEINTDDGVALPAFAVSK